MTNRIATLGVAACSAGILFATAAVAQVRFDPLFRLANVKGSCLVRAPGAETFSPVVNRKAYPFGTAVQLGPESEAVVFLSQEYSALLIGPAEATVSVQTNDVNGRIVHLSLGEARVFADESLPETAIVVETPAASCDAFTGGRATIKVTRDEDASVTMQVDATAGGMRVTGPQFAVAKLKSACGLEVRSTADRGITRLLNTGGEYVITLDNGTDAPVQFESTTRSSVKIWREFAPVGGRLIVSVFAIGPDGKGRECYAFAVGQPSVTSSGMPLSATDISNALQNASSPPGATPEMPSLF